MVIYFAFTQSENTKWPTKTFVEFNDKINEYLSGYETNSTDKVETIYVGILYLEEKLFDQLEARKLKFSLSNREMSIEIKIPLDFTEWKDIEKLLISEIIKALEVGLKRKYFKNNSIIKLLQDLA